MITIPPERELMSNAQAKVFLVQIAEYLLIKENHPDWPNAIGFKELHPLEEQVQDSMEQNLQSASVPKVARWHIDPRFPKRLVDRQGIQQDVLKLTQEEIRQVQEDDPTLLDNLGK